jgi:hypothetical protein
VFRSPIDITCVGERIVSEFTIAAGGSVTFTLQYGLSHELEPSVIDPADAIESTQKYWTQWAARLSTPTDWPGRYYRGGDDVIA